MSLGPVGGSAPAKRRIMVWNGRESMWWNGREITAEERRAVEELGYGDEVEIRYLPRVPSPLGTSEGVRKASR